MKRLSLIIPAYNEEKRISNTLERYYSFYKSLKNKKKLDFEILVVLNACRDRTLEIVKKNKKNMPELRYLDLERGGKGYAIIQGFKDALNRKNDFIGFVDADMATLPEHFYFLLKNMKNYNGAIASRWKKESIIKTRQPFLRIITSRGFNFLVRSILLLPYKDTQCGAKLFTRNATEILVKEVNSTKWAFDIDILYQLKKHGFRVKEVATVWEEKGGSKLNLIKVPIQMFSSIIRLRLIYSPFKFVVKLYNKMPDKIRIHNW
jgi:glycosyltransferase involved in cell wall biosynthesis